MSDFTIPAQELLEIIKLQQDAIEEMVDVLEHVMTIPPQIFLVRDKIEALENPQ